MEWETDFIRRTLRYTITRGYNPVKYLDPDGKQDKCSDYLFGMLSTSSNSFDILASLFYFSSNGDTRAQQKLSAIGYEIHEAGRDQLTEISDKSATGSLLFLCVGQPEVSGVLEAVSLGADGVLLLDTLVTSVNSRDAKPLFKELGFMVVSYGVGKSASMGADIVGSKYLAISTAKASVNFAIVNKSMVRS